MKKWEYLVTAWNHEYGKGPRDFSECRIRLEGFGFEGWRLALIHKGIAYFERPIEIEEQGGYRGYTYETVQDGYVIFGKDGKQIPPYELIKILGKND